MVHNILLRAAIVVSGTLSTIPDWQLCTDEESERRLSGCCPSLKSCGFDWMSSTGRESMKINQSILPPLFRLILLYSHRWYGCPLPSGYLAYRGIFTGAIMLNRALNNGSNRLAVGCVGWKRL